MNNYGKWFKAYLDKSLSVIPDKYDTKGAAIKGYQEFSDRLPTVEEASQWAETFNKSNIALMTGKLSGVVALDLDETRPEVLEVIGHLIPKSPVEKKGLKGYTRFFRYMGDISESYVYKGEMVIEILSDGKKTTLPPSKHMSGIDYQWTSEKTLLDVDVSTLPVLPPALISYIQMKLEGTLGGGDTYKYGETKSGRNASLSEYLGTVLNTDHTIDSAIKELIDFDNKNNVPPYFSDANEFRTTEPITNALNFYVSHMNSINYKRLRDNKEYLKPLLPSDVVEVSEELKKSEGQVVNEKLNLDLLPAHSVVKSMIETLLANSWVKQPQLAVGSVLATLSTLISRKFIFQGISPNLYILNISPSGSGKNAGLEFVKDTFMQCSASKLLIAGDVGSDAGLTDTVASKPQCLFLMDEMGGILKAINKSGGDYIGKTADILAEYYTCSNSAYLGRALKEGVVGSCDRPNVNILGATTPAGFRDGLTEDSIDKGLMGRFLIFEGDPYARSTRVNSITPLDRNILNQLNWISAYRPEEGFVLQNRDQLVTELRAAPAANKRLDQIFAEFDQLRIDNIHNPESPIVSRLYQQMIKLVIIHAVANSGQEVPIISVDDVEFGYLIIMNYYTNISKILSNSLFRTQQQRDKAKILSVISQYTWINKVTLIDKTPEFNARYRNSILDELLESEKITKEMVMEENKHKLYFKAV